MVNVVNIFKAYSNLDCIDLFTELPGCMFDCEIDNIYYFEITNPETMVTLLTVCLGDYKLNSDGYYHYADGTKAKFIKSRRWYEFKKAKKVIARVKLA